LNNPNKPPQPEYALGANHPNHQKTWPNGII